MEYKATFYKLGENYEVTVNGSLNHTILRIEELRKEIERIKTDIKPNSYGSRIEEQKQELENLERNLSECSIQRFSQKDEEKLNSHLSEISEEGWKLLKIEPITKGVYYERNKIGYSYNAQEGFILFWEKGNDE